MNVKKVAIDLTWVRPQKVGGTESCIRNLLDGISKINTNGISFVLLVTKDNLNSFQSYQTYACFQLLQCNTVSNIQWKRLLWQNLKMGRMLKRLGIFVCLEPVYGKPFLGTKKISFVTTIHDLQAKHYPQYFSKARVLWMKISWKNAVRTSDKVIAISKYVKKDILNTYPIPENKVKVIYNAVVLNSKECAEKTRLKEYGVEQEKYYYTVSSLFLHKNLKTLILAMAELKKRNSKEFYPLIVSGIGGRNREELDQLIVKHKLENHIIFTSFVDNADRNMLYQNCKAFLFPSIFEGFGMPPIEAMAMGVPVLTTRCTSLKEVTGGLLNYVEHPLDPMEWADRLEGELKLPETEEVLNWLKRYQCSAIAEKYVKLFNELF